jgi:hypothetical protein
VQDEDKSAVLPRPRHFRIWASILATRGTSEFLRATAFPTGDQQGFHGPAPCGGRHQERQIQIVINTGTGDEPARTATMIRRAAIKFNIPTPPPWPAPRHVPGHRGHPGNSPVRDADSGILRKIDAGDGFMECSRGLPLIIHEDSIMNLHV